MIQSLACLCIPNLYCNDKCRTRTRPPHALAPCALDATRRASTPAAAAKSTVPTGCLPVVSTHRTGRTTQQEQRWKRLESCPGGIGPRTRPPMSSGATMRMHAWGGRPELKASALTVTWALVSGGFIMFSYFSSSHVCIQSSLSHLCPGAACLNSEPWSRRRFMMGSAKHMHAPMKRMYTICGHACL